MILMSFSSRGRVDSSVNLLMRELTLVYADHDIWQGAVARTKAAGFKRVKRTRIKDAVWVIVGHKKKGLSITGGR
jgi:hypothetical protein